MLFYALQFALIRLPPGPQFSDVHFPLENLAAVTVP